MASRILIEIGTDSLIKPTPGKGKVGYCSLGDTGTSGGRVSPGILRERSFLSEASFTSGIDARDFASSSYMPSLLSSSRILLSLILLNSALRSTSSSLVPILVLE
jgi:hypothetical protein